MATQILTEAEHKRIEQAIKSAEGETSGEIVPFISERSGRYLLASWRGAGILVVVVYAVLLLVFRFYDGWGLAWLHTGWGTGLTIFVGGVLGALFVHFIPALKRTLTGSNRLAEMVHLRALEAFVGEEVFDTRDRTGILIYISLFERRIEVLGDAGINARVSADDWVNVIEKIRQGIVSNRLADGLEEAIGMCGKLLNRSGVEIKPDDENELSDRVRIRRDP